MQGHKTCRYSFNGKRMFELMDKQGIDEDTMATILSRDFTAMSKTGVVQLRQCKAPHLEIGLAIARILKVRPEELLEAMSDKEWNDLIQGIPVERARMIIERNEMIDEVSA